MPVYAVLMVLLLLVLTAPFAYVIVKKSRALTARPDLLRAMAPTLGMVFQEVVVSDETPDELVEPLLEGTLLWQQLSEAGSVNSVFTGTASGWDVYLFDIVHKPAGRSNLLRVQTAVLLTSRSRIWPMAFVIPCTSIGEPTDVVKGMPFVEVDLSARGILDGTFQITAFDGGRVAGLVAGGLGAFLEARARRNVTIESLEDRLLFYDDDRSVEPDQLATYRDEALQVASLLASR